MSVQPVEVDCGENGIIAVHSYDEIEELVQRELEAWSWLKNDRRWGLWPFVHGRLNWLLNERVGNAQRGHPLEVMRGSLTQTFGGGSEWILRSESDLGRTVADILAANGVEEAATAYVIATRRVPLRDLTGPAEVRGAMLMALPSGIEPTALAQQLTRERRNLKERADRLIARLEAADVARERALLDLKRRGTRRTIRAVVSRFHAWDARINRAFEVATKAQAEFQAHRDETQAEFESLRSAYNEAMRLQAPVQYWKDKAAVHEVAEEKARNRLLWFFPLTIFLLATAFVSTTFWLIRSPPKDATAIYLIVSGGLATIAGIAFWAGRLLTKLYLSEHHLRNDAEERAVMTTTYLALTKESAAADVDRQIILGALFRSTPDGIVKDDGPLDTNVGLLISRLLMPTK